MTKTPCPLCNGVLVARRVPYVFAGVKLGMFPAEVCGKCNEVFFTEKASLDIDETAKQKGLWGIGKRAKIGYSGHSLIVRIPTELAAAAQLKKGIMVSLQPAGKGKLLIQKE